MSAIMFDGSYRCEKCGMMVHNGVQHAKWCDGKGKNYAELIAENTALKEQLQQGRVTKRVGELHNRIAELEAERQELWGRVEIGEGLATHRQAVIDDLREQLQQGRVTKRFAELSDENARYKKALESISRDCDGCTPDEGECAITECVVMTAKIALQEGGEG